MEYRRYAEECMRLATKSRSLEVEAKLLEIAQVWFTLALQASDHESNGRSDKQ
jgi:hypothetical protein